LLERNFLPDGRRNEKKTVEQDSIENINGRGSDVNEI